MVFKLNCPISYLLVILKKIRQWCLSCIYFFNKMQWTRPYLTWALDHVVNEIVWFQTVCAFNCIDQKISLFSRLFDRQQNSKQQWPVLVVDRICVKFSELQLSLVVPYPFLARLYGTLCPRTSRDREKKISEISNIAGVYSWVSFLPNTAHNRVQSSPRISRWLVVTPSLGVDSSRSTFTGPYCRTFVCRGE